MFRRSLGVLPQFSKPPRKPRPQKPPRNRASLSLSIRKLSPTPLDGRVYVVISTTNDPEPRDQILEEEAKSQQIFGADVDGLAPGQNAIISDDALGYPAANFRDLPAGDYWVQGVLNKYTTFHRSDGHTVKLPMDEGEGQHWNSKPGNFYSVPEKIHFDPAASNAARIQIHLTKIVPPIDPPKDTEWVKHIRIQSQVLTKFWGHPMYLGAIVVIPEGWASHPNAHYPLLVNHGHFPATIFTASAPLRPPPI